jgi:hypothetical protein
MKRVNPLAAYDLRDSFAGRSLRCESRFAA